VGDVLNPKTMNPMPIKRRIIGIINVNLDIFHIKMLHIGE
jgi:hypothetical protein